MRLRPGIYLSLALLFAFAASHAARAEELPKGVVVEKVSCRGDAEQTYALYLPSGYTPEKSWPIIYAFDPGARGKLPIGLFREAAERDGYIVVGSNNSRNGPDVPLQKILTSLWDDTHARFNVDARRVYAAGFSGGARVACLFAYVYEKQVAGVIACGAGFPSNIRPSPATPFVFYGVAGVDDFNYFELRDLDHVLDELGLTHRMRTFEGGHEWPPAVVCAEALAWMQLHASKQAGGMRDEKFAEELFRRDLERVSAAEASGRAYEAYLGYAAAARDFRGLRDVSEIEKKAARLRDSKEVKDAAREEQEQKGRQKNLEEGLYRLLPGLEDLETRMQSLPEFRHTVSDLLKKSEAQKDSGERRVARRVLSGVYVSLLQDASNAYLLKDYKAASLKMETAAELRPGDPSVFVFLARTYALQGNKKNALGALKRAVEKGLDSPIALQQNKDFDALRDEPEFKKLVESLGGKVP
ncbi:MAG: hypothetical protein DMF65_05860 [Acidobacteria bacterium]|nr:MAG: hypothetical protein DMF65_05860 [Acidobacteriota bacterium]